MRILPSGGRDITMAIARGMSVEDDVAERLKRGEFGGDGEPSPEAERGSAGQLAQASEIAMQRATQFVDEIRSSLEFYTAQTQGARIERLLISGGGSKLEGFIDILRRGSPSRSSPAGSSAAWVRSSPSPRRLRRKPSRCSRPRSASRSHGEVARESGQPAPARDTRRPASAATGRGRGARRHRRDRAHLRVLRPPAGEGQRHPERHRGAEADQPGSPEPRSRSSKSSKSSARARRPSRSS